MVGGMLTTTFLSLLVLPVIYSLATEFSENRKARRMETSPANG
jgi:Cu/Ag efflux pump CusA